MIEKQILRQGCKVIEVRSDGGKLLYIKTPEGYEMKCPRTKQVCLVRYEDMLSDCLKCLNQNQQTDLNEAEMFNKMQMKG